MAALLMTKFTLLLSTLLLLHILVDNITGATTITVHNNCPHTVWPGISSSVGKPILARGGFTLPPNKSYTLDLPPLWNGRIWGRHGCSFDAAGRGKCATGDCGGNLFCAGVGGAPPATLAEFGFLNDQDFYDVSVVDGYNLAISITAFNGSGRCSYVGCVGDLNMVCPAGLQVRSGDNRHVVACKSACLAFNSPRYCCLGSFGSPDACKPTAYSKIFKAACPRAYANPFDNQSSLATCSGANYVLTFCPPPPPLMISLIRSIV